jgi:16S rRNA (cytosine967-C5)-methyltransferase
VPVDPVRDAAIEVLLKIFTKDSHIADAIDRSLRRKGGRLSPRGRRFMTQLVYGTTRHALLADYILRPLLHQPIEELPLPILLVLRMGVFQSLFLNSVTFPAMVHTSVELAKRHGHAGTARLANAVLKRVPESLDGLSWPEDAQQRLSVRYSIPAWLVARWSKEYGIERAEVLCAVSNEEAPRTIRVNTARITVADLVNRLEKKGILTQPVPLVPEALRIVEGPLPTESKAFLEGLFYIQDTASMLPPILLAPKAGERILDLCAAPGGKATHLAALADGAALIVAADKDPRRLLRVLENAARLHAVGIFPLCADAARPPFAQGQFNAVLLDAPCTGLGTLRRRPDLKWRVLPADPARLAGQQLALLRSAIALCENGGRVVYSVCTFTPEETTGVIDAIKGDGTVVCQDGPERLNPWKTSPGQYLIPPEHPELDGYFLANLRKQS